MNFLIYFDPLITFLGTLTIALFLIIILLAAIVAIFYGIFFGIKILWIYRKKIVEFDWEC